MERSGNQFSKLAKNYMYFRKLNKKMEVENKIENERNMKRKLNVDIE